MFSLRPQLHVDHVSTYLHMPLLRTNMAKYNAPSCLGNRNEFITTSEFFMPTLLTLSMYTENP